MVSVLFCSLSVLGCFSCRCSFVRLSLTLRGNNHCHFHRTVIASAIILRRIRILIESYSLTCSRRLTSHFPRRYHLSKSICFTSTSRVVRGQWRPRFSFGFFSFCSLSASLRAASLSEKTQFHVKDVRLTFLFMQFEETA